LQLYQGCGVGQCDWLRSVRYRCGDSAQCLHNTDTNYGEFDVDGSYIYECATDGASFTLKVYDVASCAGTALSEITYTSSDPTFEFECGMQDCYAVWVTNTYQTTGCTGDPIVSSETGVITGRCQSFSIDFSDTDTNDIGFSFVYACTDNSYTIITFGDATCTNELSRVELETGCISAGGFSTLLDVEGCARADYFGVAGSPAATWDKPRVLLAALLVVFLGLLF
jgi:hypothetical protein